MTIARARVVASALSCQCGIVKSNAVAITEMWPLRTSSERCDGSDVEEVDADAMDDQHPLDLNE